MKKSDQYNTPKGLANNAAQKQVPTKGSPTIKKPVPSVAVPMVPFTKKSNY